MMRTEVEGKVKYGYARLLYVDEMEHILGTSELEHPKILAWEIMLYKS